MGKNPEKPQRGGRGSVPSLDRDQWGEAAGLQPSLGTLLGALSKGSSLRHFWRR